MYSSFYAMRKSMVFGCVLLSGCAGGINAIPGFVTETPQLPLTPVSAALQCAGETLKKAFAAAPKKSLTYIYLDGFYDGTQNNRYTNGPLADYTEREFARALIRTVPFENIKFVYATPENADTIAKYGVGQREFSAIQQSSQVLLNIASSLNIDAQAYIIRGVFTQAETSPVSQNGFGFSSEVKSKDTSVSPQFSLSGSASTIALTVDVVSTLQPFIVDSNTFIMNSGTTRSDGRLSLQINDVSLGFTFQDETTASLQSVQRSLVEASAFWILASLFNYDNFVDLTPCVGIAGATPQDITKYAIRWNQLTVAGKKLELIDKLRQKGYIREDVEVTDDIYKYAIARAQNDLYSPSFKRASAYFPFTETNLGLLYLRLSSTMAVAK